MAHVLNAQEFPPFLRGKRTGTGSPPASRPGILRRLRTRLVQAMLESRQAQADREMARFLARSGGRLTDDMERRLTEHLLRGNWKE